MGSADASGSVEIAAAPEQVYALVTDLAVLAEVSAETSAARWTRGDSAAPGARFRGTNRNGWRRWSTSCTVTEAEPGRRFAFDVTVGPLPIAHWSYDISATGDGCLVVESATDRRPPGFAVLGGLATGTQQRGPANAANIAATLSRLKERAEAL